MKKIVVDYQSKMLNRRESFNVLIPDKFSDKTIILYLLHGLEGCKDDWMTYGGACNTCDKYHTIMIMPTAYNSWYLNQLGGYPYYDYIAHEVLDVFKSIFKYDYPWFVAGCSMGGYGAMKVAIKEREFIGAASFSGTLDLEQRIKLNNGAMKQTDINSFIPENDDILKLVGERQLQFIYLYCGSQDFLFPMTKENVELFSKHADKFKYVEDDGNHSWKKWVDKLDEYLEWITSNL